MDETKLGALGLGSLLYSDKSVDCLLSTVFDFQVSGLSVQVGDIKPPILEGFVARGIDRVVSDFVDAAFLICESALVEAAPGLFHTIAREYLNEFVKKFVQVDVICFIPLRIGGTADGYTDFRDLLPLPLIPWQPVERALNPTVTSRTLLSPKSKNDF